MAKKIEKKDRPKVPKASLKSARISPRKARLVADLIRGCDYDEAVRICTFTPKKASGLFKKLLEAAHSNADQLEFDSDNLFVEKVIVDMGQTMHRFRPMAQGRAGRIRKRSSHLTVVLNEKADRR